MTGMYMMSTMLALEVHTQWYLNERVSPKGSLTPGEHLPNQSDRRNIPYIPYILYIVVV